MNRKPTIGLLTPIFLPIPGYERPALDLDVELVIVTPRKIDWRNAAVSGLNWNGQTWSERRMPLPKAYYNRYYGPKPAVVDRLEAIVGKNKVFNHITRFNKWVIHNLLQPSSLNGLLPETAVYSPAALKMFLKRYSRVILKPADGNLGYGVYLITQEEHKFGIHHGGKYPIASFKTFQELLNRLDKVVTGNFLIQEFISSAKLNGRIFDLRCLVQKNGKGRWEVTGTISRVAKRYSYLTNLPHNIIDTRTVIEQVFPQKGLLLELKEISIKGARIVETHLGSLGELSVDFALDNEGKIWIIELNSKPMKNMFRELNDAHMLKRVYEAPLEYARFLATR